MTESGRGPKDSNVRPGQPPKADSQPPQSDQASQSDQRPRIQHQGVSPYQGAASAAVGTAPRNVQPRPAGHPQVNSSLPGVPAHPHVVASLAQEKEEEERLKAEKFASLSFLEKLSLSFTMTWAYKSNIIWAGLPLVGLMLAIYKTATKYHDVLASNMFMGLIVSVGLSFFSYMLLLSFVKLIYTIVEQGEPDQTSEVLLEPWSRIGQIIGPLLILIPIQSLILWLCGHLAAISSFGLFLSLAIGLTLVPLIYCYLLYFIAEDYFSVLEGLLEPLKLFISNLGLWLSLLLVSFLTIVGAGLGLYLASRIMVLFLILAPLIFLCLLAFICFFATGVITGYACYVYKQIEAEMEL